MEKIKFILSQEYIELIKLLKLLNIADTGAVAKLMVENGEIMVNLTPEFRKRRKLRKGDAVRVNDIQIDIL